jgi:hypothetical protein
MIKKLTLTNFVLAFFYLCNDLHAQIIPITVESQTFFCPSTPKDTLNKIFIRGRVTRKGEPDKYISKANVQIKNTDLSIATDSLGYYWLDISGISDASKNYLLHCSYLNHQLVEKIIDHKIEITTVVNFELTLNGGISTPETTKSKPAKKKKKRCWRK